MTSSLENLYPDINTSEPVFAQPNPVSAAEQVSHSLLVATSGHAPETYKEGELSELENEPELDTGNSDRAVSEDQNYQETVRGVRIFMD